MTAPPNFYQRNLHLDFHTGPDIPDVGKNFDPDIFAKTFVDANVDSVCVFAKCHHGHLYYNTDSSARHPGLAKGFDLLGEQIEALHKHGILAPVYLSVQCDEYAANSHPDWIAVDQDGKFVRPNLQAGWQILDMSSPYQDYLAEQLDEVLRRFAPVDGIFFDMCWDQPSTSKYAIDGMRKRGYNPHDDGDRKKYAREVAYGYMERYRKMIDAAHNGHNQAWIWFNSRPKVNLHIEKKYVNHVLVECLPTGGWGYAYFPYVIRYIRPQGLPIISHTGRFHKSWADFGGLKPESAMKYECCQMLSQGAAVGIGDQMHPRGTLDKPAYDRIGRIFGYVKECEQWVAGGKLLSEMAVLIDPALGDRPGNVGLGCTRALQELKFQFDFLPPSADLNGYPLVVVPEMVKIDEILKSTLKKYLEKGGALIVSGSAALDDDGNPAMDELGVKVHGESPYSVTYLRADKTIADGLPEMDHVMYERGFRMTAVSGAKSLCRVVEPYFERTYEHFCSHGHTPPDKLSRYSAIIQNGRVITFSVPIFTAYGAHASEAYRHVLGNCVKRLLPEPIVQSNGPVSMETSVVLKKGRTIVHLISFCPVRKAASLDIVEDPFPLVDVSVSVKLAQKPKRVLLAPSVREIPFEYRNGRAHVKVTCLDGHVMLVFE